MNAVRRACRIAALACVLAAWPAAALHAGSDAPVRIAIIIDDLGNNLALGREAVTLPGALTYSVLPLRPYSAELARQADARGKEVMLHLPMQTSGGRAIGHAGLSLGMQRAEFTRVLGAGLASVPHAVGVNNHMGSLLTQHPGAMRWLMEDMSCYDRLYFVDSRTDVRTVARRHAREAGLAHAERDVFLDNRQEPDYIRGQLRKLIRDARRGGSAIGIGHPYPATLAVLAEEIPRLADQGVQLVPVSRLVVTDRNEGLWHASSSPLRTAAKNSKP